MYKLEELISNNKMEMKDNISYLGNGVDLINAVKEAREHFNTLQQDFERNFDDGVILKVHKCWNEYTGINRNILNLDPEPYSKHVPGDPVRVAIIRFNPTSPVLCYIIFIMKLIIYFQQGTVIISQGKSDNFGDTQTYAQFAADYPTWFMTLTECSDNEQFNSNRDCPKQEIVNEFKLERHPTRNKIQSFF